MYKQRIKTCEHCLEDYYTRNPTQKFCSHKCAGFGNNAQKGKSNFISDEQKLKISQSLKKTRSENPEKFPRGEKHSESVGKSTKGKYNLTCDSLFEISSRTKSKILKRLNIGCCICNWNDCVCDLHHINGRQIADANNHSNLAYVCPNCHRKIHEGQITKEQIIPLNQQIGDNWKEFYYG